MNGSRETPHTCVGSSMSIHTDLSQFIVRPEYVPKVSMSVAALSREAEASSRNSSKSSAYGWERIKAARGSMVNANRRGDIGHPCLVPLLRLNVCDVIPLMRRHALGEV